MTLGRRFLPPAPRLTRRAWEDVAPELEHFLRALWGGDLGIPGGFAGTTPGVVEVGGADAGTLAAGWAAADHDHDVTVDIVGGLGDVNSEGTSVALARADHVHKRSTRVAYNGVDVGTRNRVNFTLGGGVPTDDPGNDEVDVPIPVDVGILAYYGL
jgi:hypothetical protein